MNIIPFLSNNGYNKIISNQTQFEELDVEENDNIFLDGFFLGGIDVDEDNVSITGGGITGGEDISGLTWTNEGGGIYSVDMVTDPQWINIDGINAKLAETDWKVLTGTTSTNQVNVTHSDVSGYTSIVGCYIVFKDRPFSYSERYTITAYNGAGVITLDRPRHSNIGTGDGYKLFNYQEFIDGNNEWIWRGGKVKIKSTANPSTMNITKSVYNYGVNVTANNCTLENIEIKEHYLFGVTSTTDNLSVFLCEIHDIRGQGIKSLTQTNTLKILNNTIYNIGHNGVWFGPINGVSIKHNNIYNIGMGYNIGWNNESFDGISFTDGTAIKCNLDLSNPTHDASNIYIENNIIDNTAYNGISLHIGQVGRIRRNIVTNTNKLLDDGGAIYCFHYRDTDIPFTDFLIEENFVSLTGTVGRKQNGIYLDNRCAGNEVSNNVVIVFTCDVGILINADTEQNNVHNNTVYATGLNALEYKDWAAPDKIYPNDENLIHNNILIAASSTTYPLEFSESVNPYLNGGSGNNNIYVKPYGTGVLFDTAERTLAELQSIYSQDADSVSYTDYIATTPDPENEILIIQNPSDNELSGTAPAGDWYDVYGVLTTSYTVPAWRSLVLLKDLI